MRARLLIAQDVQAHLNIAGRSDIKVLDVRHGRDRLKIVVRLDEKRRSPCGHLSVASLIAGLLAPGYALTFEHRIHENTTTGSWTRLQSKPAWIPCCAWRIKDPDMPFLPEIRSDDRYVYRIYPK